LRRFTDATAQNTVTELRPHRVGFSPPGTPALSEGAFQPHQDGEGALEFQQGDADHLSTAGLRLAGLV